MLNYADKERLEAKVKEATYANMLGKMVMEATPIALRNKLLGDMSIKEDEFIISAGAIISELIPYDEFVNRIEALKNRVENDEEPADLDNPEGEKLTDADASDILYVCGLIKEGVEMNVNKMYSEVMALPDSVTSLDQLNIKNEVPDAIKNILAKDNISNFTADVMRAITTDIKNDIAIKQADEQAENDMVTKVSEIEGDDDLSGEAIPPMSGDLENPDTPANTEETNTDGGTLDIPATDTSDIDDMEPISLDDEPADENADTETPPSTEEGNTEDVPATEEVIDDGAPISLDEEPVEDNNEVGVDDSVEISDDDADVEEESTSDEEVTPTEGDEEFSIGKDAGAEDTDIDSDAPIEVTPSEDTAEDHLDDLDDMHEDINSQAEEDKDNAGLIQEALIRKRVAYIPALQNLAVKLFKEDLEHSRKAKQGYVPGENDMVTQLSKMFSEAAEIAKKQARTNPLTEHEYKTLLYGKMKNVDSYYDTVKTEYARVLRLYNGDEKKAQEYMKKNKNDEFTVASKILFDVLVLLLIGVALGFAASVIIPLLPTWATFGAMIGMKLLHTSVFVTAILHALIQVGKYAKNSNDAKVAFDTAMDAVRYSKDLSDAEKAKVETYAKNEFEKYNSLPATQKTHGIDVTKDGFFSRLALSFS